MPDICVGKRIRELREIQKLTREELAEEIDISPKYLYEIETGKKNFSSDILCKLALSLSVSCDYIMLGEDSSRREEKIVTIIEHLNTKQVLSVQRILRILCELCDIWEH